MARGICRPRPGDLIEIDRPLYQHWALYLGHGYVIHVTAVDENALPLSASTVTILTRRAMVKKELLTKVAGNDAWKVNNKYDRFCRPLPVEEIIRRAESRIGEKVPYRLLRNNCEHFVTELRYGKKFSYQAWSVFQFLRDVFSAIAWTGLATLSFLISAAVWGIGGGSLVV